MNDDLKLAVEAAIAGEWDRSHRIVQEFNDPIACWIHAVLHKIEGDAGNSRYWYARAPAAASYEAYAEAVTELEAIRQQLNGC